VRRKRTVWESRSVDAFLHAYEDARSPCNRGSGPVSPREAESRLRAEGFSPFDPETWASLTDAYCNGWDDAQRGDSFRHDLLRFGKATNANGQTVYANQIDLDALQEQERRAEESDDSVPR